MLNDVEFPLWCKDLNLTAEGRSFLEKIRSMGGPIRQLQGKGGNVITDYPSQKMGRVIKAESHTVELAGIYDYEHDNKILEYWDQPIEIKLSYLLADGTNHARRHIPDFLILRPDSVGFEEWKPIRRLLKLAEEKPYQYIQDANGQWRCPPAEAYAEQFGLYYKLRTSNEINGNLYNNVEFLAVYFRNRPTVAPAVVDKVLSLVQENVSISLSELYERAKPIEKDDIHALIATEQIFVDLRAADLKVADSVRVYRDRTLAVIETVVVSTQSPIADLGIVTLETNAQFIWGSTVYTIINIDHNNGIIWVRSDATDGKSLISEFPVNQIQELVKRGKITGLNSYVESSRRKEASQIVYGASPKAQEKANKRYKIIKPYLDGKQLDEQTRGARSIRRWISKYLHAQEFYGSGFTGLISHEEERGYRGSRLPQAILDIIKKHNKEVYETYEQPSMYTVYCLVKGDCEAQGLIAPSYPTVVKVIKKQPLSKQTQNRRGRRAANEVEEFIWEFEFVTPRHGGWPFHIIHIDHTLLDIELIDPNTGENLGRPWASFAVDGNTRRVVGLYVTFDPPSYRSCMMILREIVRRYGRLPEIIVVDGGSDFRSAYFDKFLAMYGITKKHRPWAKPHFGSTSERLFGTANTEFIHTCIGNTQIMKQVRQVTKSNNPKNNAVWTLETLFLGLREWAYEIYDQLNHSTLNTSPRNAFIIGLEQYGQRLCAMIPYDQTFVLTTLPSVKGEKVKVDPSRGIRVNYDYYWNKDFRNSALRNTYVSVRYDPWDYGVVYAFVKFSNTKGSGKWIKCMGSPILCGRTEKEMRLIDSEIHRQNKSQNTRKHFGINALMRAKFLQSKISTEKLLKQRAKDSEQKKIHRLMEGKASTEEPVQPPPPTPVENQDKTNGDDKTPPYQPTIYEDFE